MQITPQLFLAGLGFISILGSIIGTCLYITKRLNAIEDFIKVIDQRHYDHIIHLHKKGD